MPDYLSMTPADFGHDPAPQPLAMFATPDPAGTPDLWTELEPAADDDPRPCRSCGFRLARCEWFASRLDPSRCCPECDHEPEPLEPEPADDEHQGDEPEPAEDRTATLPEPLPGSDDLRPTPAPKVLDLATVPWVCANHPEVPAVVVFEVARYHPTKQSGGGYLARYIGACAGHTGPYAYACRARARSAARIYSRGWEPADEPLEHDLDNPSTLF